MSSTAKKPFANIDWRKAIIRITWIISLGFLGNLLFIYWTTDSFQIGKLLEFSPFWLFICFLLCIFPWVAHAWEIQVWSHFFKKKINFLDAFLIAVTTDLGSAITPTMIGGGPIKLGLLKQKELSSGQAAAMVSFTGIEDALFIIFIIPISIAFSTNIQASILSNIFNGFKGEVPKVIALALSIILGLILIYYLLKQFKFLNKIRLKMKEIVKDFLSAYHMIIKEGKTHFALATFAIALRWVARFLVVLALVAGLGLSVDLKELFLSQWKIYAGMTITPTPGATGGAEGLFFIVFKGLIPPDYLPIIIMAWRFFTYYLVLILAVVFFNILSVKSSLFRKD